MAWYAVTQRASETAWRPVILDADGRLVWQSVAVYVRRRDAERRAKAKLDALRLLRAL